MSLKKEELQFVFTHFWIIVDKKSYLKLEFKKLIHRVEALELGVSLYIYVPEDTYNFLWKYKEQEKVNQKEMEQLLNELEKGYTEAHVMIRRFGTIREETPYEVQKFISKNIKNKRILFITETKEVIDAVIQMSQYQQWKKEKRIMLRRIDDNGYLENVEVESDECCVWDINLKEGDRVNITNGIEFGLQEKSELPNGLKISCFDIGVNSWKALIVPPEFESRSLYAGKKQVGMLVRRK